ncbi:PLP-dependent aminotransferase family protein [Pseudoalteromonas maricaloris]|uniref:aminotransferase-like domain-containing protein n=1 Tax=Pseudoalteromonas maricaloris TaxID=184924 RepID=UPI003C293F94
MEQLEVMNFLNEVATKFSDAISLASGRPNPKYLGYENWGTYQSVFESYFAQQTQYDVANVKSLLYQYGPSAGIINEILKQYLAKDEAIDTNSNNIIVTNGCQEALTLICLHELQHDHECILTLDPAYIGLSGLLTAIGKRVEPIDIRPIIQQVEGKEPSFDWSYLRDRVTEIRAQGLVPKAIYVNPDFNNPLAYRLSREDRLSLLTVCDEIGLKVIEDDPYSRFDYSGSFIESLCALDTNDIVYHIGSFSKTLCPGLRMGYLVMPEKQKAANKALISLKSLVSVNTNPLTQSIVGGYLLSHNFSLAERMEELNAQYIKQRDAVQRALDTQFSNLPGVTWNKPEGGFFVVVNLPFEFNEQDVYTCASETGVICMPVSFFSLNPEAWQSSVRIAFSNYDPADLEEGVRRFGQYVSNRIIKSQ